MPHRPAPAALGVFFTALIASTCMSGGPRTSPPTTRRSRDGDYGSDDSGRYIQTGPTIYKALKLSDRFTLYPFAGFAFVSFRRETYRGARVAVVGKL